MITHPLRCRGGKLVVNYSTSASGSLGVEIQDLEAKPWPGFALADCRPLVGDAIEQAVTWAQGGDVSSLAGRPVRLRFRMLEADLFSIRFEPPKGFEPKR